MIKTAREAYEAWARKHSEVTDYSKRVSGHYADDGLQDDWEVWEAAWKAALEAQK